MNDKYLIINAGSSSLKFSLYSMPEAEEIVNGIVERIATKDSSYTLKFAGKKIEKQEYINSHEIAVKVVLRELLEKSFIKSLNEIVGIGNRILHGGEKYSDSVLIDDSVLNDIKLLTKLGPLHHPGEIAVIESLYHYLPNISQVAVFDTAFHQTIPKENFIYAVPYSWYQENGVRKYGFHGTSHKYITEVMQQKLNKTNVNLIICHVGSGVSISEIKDGKSFNTTMGLTPLDGTVMGTRSGSIDPSILEYVSKERNLSLEEITDILNHQSGLLGIVGKNDFRDVEKMADDNNKKAILAISLLKKSIIKYIAQYYFELNGEVDAIIFTAGIGENVSSIRKDIVNEISKPLNIKLNEEMNNNIARFKKYQSGIIAENKEGLKIYVIPTNEEFMILKDTYKIVKEKSNNKTKKLIRGI